ncbi:MAG: NAD(P)-dependent oxidoreductase [Acidimicrobiia bacterium]|nr:NAD(P)-dependent oxidoreductase [Acidimicrobiia bacterium]
MARYFVTGAQGCIGAWVVKNLVDRGQDVIVFDVDLEPRRLGLLLDAQALSRVQFLRGDVCDSDQVSSEVLRQNVDYIIHLAGLQVPTCRANPKLGAMVNVVGTINVFEAARARGNELRGLVYASSAAVFGPEEDYGDNPLDESASLLPETHYGVFKQCNEGNARIYYRDHRLSSVGLRPFAVYGPGRDFGITSGPTKALKAAVVGRSFEIKFGGSVSMQFVDDTAKTFIACAESRKAGARVYNIRGAVMTVEEFIQVVEEAYPRFRGLIRCTANTIGIASNLAEQGLRDEIGTIPTTDLKAGIEATVQIFQRLQSEGRLDLSDLDK